MFHGSHGGTSRTSPSANLEIFLGIDEVRYSFAEDWMVIYDQHPAFCARGGMRLFGRRGGGAIAMGLVRSEH